MTLEKGPRQPSESQGEAQKLEALASQPKEYTFGDRKIVLTNPYDIRTTDSLIAAGTRGRYTQELARNNSNPENPTPQAIHYVSKIISRLIKAGVPIENLTSPKERAERKRSIYVLSGAENGQLVMGEVLKTEDYQEIPATPWRLFTLSSGKQTKHPNELNEPIETKTPKEILAIKATDYILSNLLDESLMQSTGDLRTILTNIINGNPLVFKGAKSELDTLLNDPSPSRPNRFFRVNFMVILDGAWDKDITPDTPEDEMQIAEKCNKLKEKAYDKKGVIQKVFSHFTLIPPPEYV